MQVRQLGHRVTDRVVERAALGDVAAFDMGGRNVHLGAGDDRGEAFEAVGIDDQQIGPELVERLARSRSRPMPIACAVAYSVSASISILTSAWIVEAVSCDLLQRRPKFASRCAPETISR